MRRSILSHDLGHPFADGKPVTPGGTQWPDSLPATQRREYNLVTIKQWLEVFLLRFIQTSQFKRSCLPNAPKVGSGGALSPRIDWRAPSDAEAEACLRELRTRVCRISDSTCDGID